MPRQVDHRERRETIARALWRVVEQQGLAQATLRTVAQEAGVSLGQLQHYFSSRSTMLTFAVDFASEQSARRVEHGLHELGEHAHPREILRVTLTAMLPLHPDSRATSRMSAAYVAEALHDPDLHARARDGVLHGRAGVEELVRTAIVDGYIDRNRDPAIEADLLLALTGFTTLLELGVVEPQAALAAIDSHLDRLFTLSNQ